MRLSLRYFLLSCFCMTAATAAPSQAMSLNELKLNGFLDLEYERSYSDNASLGDTKGSFDQAHFNILMEFPVSHTLTVKGHIEYEHGPWLKGAGDSGELTTEWAYLEYLVGNTLRFRAGKILTPFGVYNEIHDATPTYLSIRIPWEIYRANEAGGFPMFPTFGTGISLLGDYLAGEDLDLNYSVYMVNGENDVSGLNEAERDENSDKAIGGRLMLSPRFGTAVGGSFFTGKKGVDKKNHSTWAVTVDYGMSMFNARAEYASSELDNQTEKGWYGEVSYRFRKVTPFLRYGTLDPNDDEWRELVYGIHYEIQPNFVLKLENRQFGGNPNNALVSDDYNEVAAALAAAF